MAKRKNEEDQDIQNDRYTNEMSTTKFIYFIEAVDDDSIKIGQTSNIDVYARLRNLQTGNAHELILLGFFVSNYSDIHFHEMFESLHIRGEWFKKSPELAEFISSNCGKLYEYESYLINKEYYNHKDFWGDNDTPPF